MPIFKVFGCLTILVLFIALSCSGCAESKYIDGKNYQPYGLVNENEIKDDSIIYTVPPGGIILSVIFIETIIAPVYVIGWDLYEPVRKR